MRTSAMIGDAVEQLQHVERRHLAAQMQEVLGLQQIGVGQRVEIDHAVAEGADALLVEAEIAEAQRVEHRGDAGGGALRVVRDHGGARRPARQRARLHLTFQIVGVHVDDRRGSDSRRPGRGRQRGGAVRLHLRDRGRRARTKVPCSVASGSTRMALVRIVSVVHAASCNGVSGNSRSAMASRTSASWQIATIAVPRAFASLIMRDDHRAVLGIERRGRFVQQQHRMAADEAARQVHALLLAAGEGRRRQGVQPARDVQPQQQPGARCRAPRPASTPRPISTSATTSSAGTRGTTRRNWLT